MGDQLHRHLVHPPLEPALGDESVAKARARQIIGEPQAQLRPRSPPRRALRERDVAGDRAQRKAQPVERGIGEAVAAVERGRPQFLVVVEGEVEALDRAERLVEVPQPLPRGDRARPKLAGSCAEAASRILSSRASSGAKSTWPPSVSITS